jgi:PhzF family phenazine biosynthesis protein
VTIIKLYQVDAFAEKIFAGNPAAVCPLNDWLPEQVMQDIAMENNLAETAFFVKKDDRYEIRWFTPSVEVDLCGHATLASAYVLFNHENHRGDSITFYSHRSGILTVKKEHQQLTLDFPVDVLKQIEITDEHWTAFGVKPKELYRGKTDFMMVFENESQIKNLKPDFKLLNNMDCRGVIVTAKGDTVDFVSRFFAPQSGIDEDPVTGSAHTSLTPYWSTKLGKKTLSAIQLSRRRGMLSCTDNSDRILISGQAKLYLKGEIQVTV